MSQAPDLPLRCSVLLADAEQRYTVKTALKECGHALVFCSDVAESVVNASHYIDVYFTRRSASGSRHVRLPAHGYTLELDHIPGINSADFVAWKADIRARVDEIVQRHDAERADCQASRVWLLAASAGGLKAVTEFLRHTIPLTNGNVGFIYAQHIESSHVSQLVRMVRRQTPWQAELAQESSVVKGGVVTVVSPDYGVRFAEDGRITLNQPDAADRYRPSIDGLCRELARHYGAACGMIAFSGMGDDGVDGSRAIIAGGGEVWLQSPDSCEVSALPEAILRRGAFDACADVASLAKKFGDLSAGRSLEKCRQ